jgi:hypothetical protein
MALPPESPEAGTPRLSVFEPHKWAWPILSGTLIGLGLRATFFGRPGAPFSAMMALFAVLAPIVIGAVTVVSAERSTRGSWGYYFWSAAGANALCALIAFAVTIEGLICVVLAVPLFVLLGGISGLITGFMSRRVIRPHRSLYGIAVLPLLLGGFEQQLPLPQTVLSQQRFLVTNASREVVWQQLMTARGLRPDEMNQA